MLKVPAAVLERFRAFSLYNSPYHAHDDGSAIDLYPGSRHPFRDGRSPIAPSPVAGEVVAIERVRAPPKPYAPEHDYVVAIDTGTPSAGAESTLRTEDGEPAIARCLHADPTGEAGVGVGDRIAAGEPLGELLRAGFFAPWVGPHLHLDVRRRGDDLLRATGSLQLEPAVDVEPVAWGGTGTVVEAAATYAVLDRPIHPDPGECFAGIAGSIPITGGDRRSIPLDGGLPHYDRGGIFGGGTGAVSLGGTGVGDAEGRTIAWRDPIVTVDGTPIHGLSLAASREDLGAKVICPDLALSLGDEVRVAID